MIIPAQIDESTIGDINKYVEDSYNALKESKPVLVALGCSFKGRINEKLQERTERAYEDIMGLVNSSDYDKAMAYDSELAYFKKAADIYQLERGNEYTIFDGMEYVEDFSKIYRRICQFLRRIQLEVGDNLCKEIIPYINEHSISVVALSQILLTSDVGHKDKVAITLATYYQHECRFTEALYLIGNIEDNCRDEFLDKMKRVKTRCEERVPC